MTIKKHRLWLLKTLQINYKKKEISFWNLFFQKFAKIEFTLIPKTVEINLARLKIKITGQWPVISLNFSVNFMRTKATSADIHSLNFSVYQYANSLNIGFPGSLCFQMGVGNIETRSGMFSANFTIISHVLHLLALPQLQHS